MIFSLDLRKKDSLMVQFEHFMAHFFSQQMLRKPMLWSTWCNFVHAPKFTPEETHHFHEWLQFHQWGKPTAEGFLLTPSQTDPYADFHALSLSRFLIKQGHMLTIKTVVENYADVSPHREIPKDSPTYHVIQHYHDRQDQPLAIVDTFTVLTLLSQDHQLLLKDESYLDRFTHRYRPFIHKSRHSVMVIPPRLAKQNDPIVAEDVHLDYGFTFYDIHEKVLMHGSIVLYSKIDLFSETTIIE